MTEFATRHKLPVEATRGGAETMYPDFLAKGAQPQPIALRQRLPPAASGCDIAAGHPDPAGARQRLHAARRRRQHHRLGRPRRRADGRCRTRADDRPGAGRDPPAAERSRSARQTARQRRRDAIERGEPQHRAAGQADSLHHRHAAPIPTTPAATKSSALAGRTFTGGNVAGNIADAGEGAAILAHENVLQRLTRARGRRTESAARRAADRHLLHRLDEAESLLQRRRDPADSSAVGAHRRRQPGVVPRLGRHRRRRHLFDRVATR